jgi:hypothetical protein
MRYPKNPFSALRLPRSAFQFRHPRADAVENATAYHRRVHLFFWRLIIAFLHCGYNPHPRPAFPAGYPAITGCQSRCLVAAPFADRQLFGIDHKIPSVRQPLASAKRRKRRAALCTGTFKVRMALFQRGF